MYVFRSMMSNDASVVVEIERTLFTDPWPPESFVREPFENDKSFAFVAEKENEIIGYIMGWYVECEIHIGNLAVKKQYQQQGIGTYLLNSLLEHFSDFEICFLEVRENNHSAQKLYKKFGFKNVYIRKSYYKNGENALIMSKQREN
jgi:[ribosomal protein S18]-alanine N-acetyltransferase